MRISDWSSDVCSSDLSMPTTCRRRQRPERRTLIGAETAMVRPLGFLVGLGFIAALLCAIFTTPLSNEPNAAHEFHKHPRHLALSSDGLFPRWDLQKLQRGMQVYKAVCSACHSLNHVASIGRASCREKRYQYV